MVDQEDGEAEEIRLGRVCVWCVDVGGIGRWMLLVEMERKNLRGDQACQG
jgi:hypothetical protein